jgi:hypothetical protein
MNPKNSKQQRGLTSERVRDLFRRASEAEAQANVDRQKAQKAKAQFKMCRKAFKKARRLAKQARKEANAAVTALGKGRRKVRVAAG